MKNQKPVASDKSEVVAALPVACSNETTAVEFMEQMRWNGEPSCPRCGVVGECRQMKDRKTGERNKRFLWACHACKRQFTVRIGTVFEDSRIPLRHWCYAFWAACASKKGVSALQIRRMTGLSYKSALFLMHRIRWAMADENPRPLSGDVEVDETYVGGKPRYPRMGKRGHGTKKARVMAMVERGGEIRPIHLRRIGAGELKRAVLEHMDSSARILSDEERSYTKLGQHFSGGHEAVKHSAGEYARGDVHVNTAEGFFALLKRGIHGTFHSVSKKHLHRYLSEFQFRWNTRGLDDGARTAQAIRKADGKRLVYRESKAKTEQ